MGVYGDKIDEKFLLSLQNDGRVCGVSVQTH